MKIVALKLVNSAVKYGKQRTPITLKSERKDGEAVFSVHNEGIGITVEDIQFREAKASPHSTIGSIL